MDHSGLDGELINSPSACWDSRQGELSASSVSGRALAELLQTELQEGRSRPGPLDHSSRVFGPRRLTASPFQRDSDELENPLKTNCLVNYEAVINKYYQTVVSYKVERIDPLLDRLAGLVCCIYVWIYRKGRMILKSQKLQSFRENWKGYLVE